MWLGWRRSKTGNFTLYIHIYIYLNSEKINISHDLTQLSEILVHVQPKKFHLFSYKLKSRRIL
jgi:hypothetical protein